MPKKPPSDRACAKGLPPMVNSGLPDGHPSYCLLPKNAKRTQNRTHAADVPPVFNPGLSDGDTPHNPKIRNEPNFHIPRVPPPPISAKRTQFAPTSTLPRTKNAKRTQSQPPIYILQSTIYNPMAQFLVPLASRRFSHPNYAKRTQFAPAADLWRTKKCETNPISSTADLWNPQIHETNPISPRAGLNTED